MQISSADSVRDAGKKSVRFEEDYKQESRLMRTSMQSLSIRESGNRQLLMMPSDAHIPDNQSVISKAPTFIQGYNELVNSTKLPSLVNQAISYFTLYETPLVDKS